MKVSAKTGFVGIGTSAFIRAAFDNIQISDGTVIHVGSRHYIVIMILQYLTEDVKLILPEFKMATIYSNSVAINS